VWGSASMPEGEATPTPAPPPAPGPTPEAPGAPAKPPRTPRKPRAASPPATPPAAKETAPASVPPKPAKKPAPAPTPRPSTPRAPPETVVDATGLVLGRAASLIAKRLMNGENIVVVNAEQSVVTGDRAMVLETYRANRARGSKRTGPHFPRYPDRIFRRTVRGMLPHLKTRGIQAFERLKVHIGIPPEYQGQPRQVLETARARPALRRPLTLAEISRLLGARL